MKLYHILLSVSIGMILALFAVLHGIETKIDRLTMTKEVYWLLPSATACSDLWERDKKIYVKGEKDMLWYEKKENE